MITTKSFAHRFNKLKLTNTAKVEVNAELWLSVNMVLQAILELKASSQSEKVITPIARLYGAVHRLKQLQDRHVIRDEYSKFKDLNFYLILLELEETAVQLITTLNLFYVSFGYEDATALHSYTYKLEALVNKLVFVKGLQLSDVMTEALAIYNPISVYKGNKTLRRKKYLKKKLVDNMSSSLDGLLDRYTIQMNTLKPSGESKEK